MIRHVLGNGDGEIIGCTDCGEVEHVLEGKQHYCRSLGNSPYAATIETKRLSDAKNTPTYQLASPSNRPAILSELLKLPPQ